MSEQGNKIGECNPFPKRENPVTASKAKDRLKVFRPNVGRQDGTLGYKVNYKGEQMDMSAIQVHQFFGLVTHQKKRCSPALKAGHCHVLDEAEGCHREVDFQ